MTVPQAAVSPKIELHVHLEGTIRARTLLGVSAPQVYQAASRGGLCDEGTRRKIIAIGE